MTAVLSRHAYDHIREQVAMGLLTEGRRVSEREIAQQIGISRTPVREAIHRLQTEGLLENGPHHGASVRKISRDELADLLACRELMEVDAAGRAAERRTGAGLAEINRRFAEWMALSKRIQRAGFHNVVGQIAAEAIAADMNFHRAILRAAGNAWMERLVDQSRVLLRLLEFSTTDPRSDYASAMSSTDRDHRAIRDAIRRRNPAAARKAMAHHLQKTAEENLAGFENNKSAKHRPNSDTPKRRGRS